MMDGSLFPLKEFHFGFKSTTNNCLFLPLSIFRGRVFSNFWLTFAYIAGGKGTRTGGP